MKEGNTLGQIILDDSELTSAFVARETKSYVFFNKIKSWTVFVDEDDKPGIPAKCFEPHSASAGKKIENLCSLDVSPQNTEQGFPGLIRCRPDTLVMKRRRKELSTFDYSADNSQKFTKLRGTPKQFLQLEQFDRALLQAQFQEVGRDRLLNQIE